MSPISMKFHSFTLFLALLLYYFSHYANGEDECISCASSIFASEWQVTGFPIHPPRSTDYTYVKGTPVKVKSFVFTDQCDKKYDESTNKLPRTPCSGGICIEMLLLANGVYGTVRGCLSDFYLSSKQPPIGKEQCIMGKQNQNTTIWEGDKPNPVPQTSVGFSTCRSTTGDIPCNNILEAKLNFALGTKKKLSTDTNSAWSTNCEDMAGSVECLECQRYDMEGTCNWDVRKYCNGGWCTKTIGYVNGRWLEVRGCAPINPLNSQTCFKIDKTTQFPLLADVDVPRTVSIEHCMCATQKCNGAMKMAGKIIPIELLLILAISISIMALKLN